MHIITNYKYWIFDMDGTLTIHSMTLTKFANVLIFLLGLKYWSTFNLYLQKIKQRHKKILEEWEFKVAEQTLVADDAVSFLQHLHEHNAKMAILTRNIEKLAYLTLSVSGLLRYFEPSLLHAIRVLPNLLPWYIQNLRDVEYRPKGLGDGRRLSLRYTSLL